MLGAGAKVYVREGAYIGARIIFGRGAAVSGGEGFVIGKYWVTYSMQISPTLISSFPS